MELLLKFTRLSQIERILLVKAVTLMAVIRIGLLVIPFKRLYRLVSEAGKKNSGRHNSDPEYQKHVVYAISRASKYFHGNNTCLIQSVVGLYLLEKNGISTKLCIGVVKNDSGGLCAHAWVESNGKIIIGGTKSPLNFMTLTSLSKISKQNTFIE